MTTTREHDAMDNRYIRALGVGAAICLAITVVSMVIGILFGEPVGDTTQVELLGETLVSPLAIIGYVLGLAWLVVKAITTGNEGTREREGRR